MAATVITTTAQDITGDFDLVVRGVNGSTSLLKSLGSGTTNWVTLEPLADAGNFFVKNTGTNSFKLSTTIAGKTIEFSQ